MIAVSAGMMRTGSAYIYYLMGDLLSLAGKTVNTAEWGTSVLSRQDGFHNSPDDWVVGKSHKYPPTLDRFIKEDKVRAVMTVRDLRDVVVSMMGYWSSTFENVINRDEFRENLDNGRHWEDAMQNAPTRMKILRYEDIVANPVDAGFWVAHSLGLRMPGPLVAEAVRRNTIASQKIKRPGFAKKHILSGQPGRWLDVLSVEQVALLEKRHGLWMQQHGYVLVS